MVKLRAMFYKHLFKSYYILGTNLGPGDTAVENADTVSTLMGLTFSRGR